MIDINELRRRIDWGYKVANGVVSEILDQLEEAESNAAHQKALAESALRVAEGWEERCNALRAEIKERDALQAKIEQRERQEPVAKIRPQYTLLFARNGSITGIVKRYGLKISDPLYALPGAQPAPSVPDVDALAQFIREVDGSHQLGAGVLAERIAEWLKAAPEAKP